MTAQQNQIEPGSGKAFFRSLLMEAYALASHFRLLELGGDNRSVESGAQLLGRLQRQLDPRPRAGVELRVVKSSVMTSPSGAWRAWS